MCSIFSLYLLLFSNSVCSLVKDGYIVYIPSYNYRLGFSAELEMCDNKYVNAIECIILKIIIQTVSHEQSPSLTLPNLAQWSNYDFTDRLQLKKQGNIVNREIRFSREKSRLKFSIIIHLLGKIYKLLRTGSTCTRRELYYQDVEIMRSQVVVDCEIRTICTLLEAASWDLGVLSSSKGLVAGPLLLCDKKGGDIIDCGIISGGTLVPQNVNDLKIVKCTATYVILVEKDTVFQKLLDEDALTRLKNSLIITGKGFPDINTRLLLKLLCSELKIPIYALMDADAYGIAIMCVYRYGSLGMGNDGDKLAVPEIRWLGIYPSEISQLNMPTVALTDGDLKKLGSLLKRPFVISNERLFKQIKCAIKIGKKAEIEGLHNIYANYLTSQYIGNKISINRLI